MFGFNDPKVRGELNNACFIKIPDNFFLERYQRIMLVLDKQINSDMLKPDEPRTTDRKLYINVIKEKLISIAESNEAETIKRLKMEEYILSIYQDVKNNEGLRPSRLRKGLEWIMTSDGLLGLTNRYGVNFSGKNTSIINRGILLGTIDSLKSKTSYINNKTTAIICDFCIKFLMKLNEVQTQRASDIAFLRDACLRLSNNPSVSSFIKFKTSVETLSKQTLNENKLSLFKNNSLGNFIDKFVLNEIVLIESKISKILDSNIPSDLKEEKKNLNEGETSEHDDDKVHVPGWSIGGLGNNQE